MPRPRPALAPAAASALLAAALYAVTLAGTFIYDSVALLLEDARATHPHLWGLYWTTAYNEGADNLFRPLTSMSFALEWAVGGMRPWHFHLANLLLHAAVSAAVATLAVRLAAWRPGGTPARAGWVAGLLFAALPVHAEAVAAVYGRAELLAALGTVGGLAALIGKPLTARRAAAVFACFLVALLSKEQGMLFPLLAALLLTAQRLARADLPPTADREPLKLLAALACLTLAGYVAYRESILPFFWNRGFLDPTIQPMIQSRGADRLLLPIALLGRYAQLLVVPLKLSIDYGQAVIGPTIPIRNPYLWLGIAAGSLWLLATAAAVRRRSWAAAAALLAAAAAYAPAANLLTVIGTVFGERLIYLPSAFLLIALALAAARLPDRSNRLLTVGLAVLLALFALRTVTYAARWTDRLRFYQLAAADQPKSVRLQLLLGNELLENGRLADAADAGARMRQLAPWYARSWLFSGRVATRRGRFDEAEAYLTEGGRLEPSGRAAAMMDDLRRARHAATQPAP